MIKRLQPRAESGAPAYMVQYTAVTMLLLAFFIAILSQAMGASRQAGWKPGLGAVRNAFGAKGGFGLRPYLKAARNLKDRLLGAWGGGVALPADKSSVSVDEAHLGLNLRLAAPFDFVTNSAILDKAAQAYIERVGAVLLATPRGAVTLRAWCEATGEREWDEQLALERAVAVLRHMEQQAGVPRRRMEAVGSADRRNMRELTAGQLQARQALFFDIRRQAEE